MVDAFSGRMEISNIGPLFTNFWLRFKGSTLSVQGLIGPASSGDEGDWAVVGGTGEFVYAQGTCKYKRIQTGAGGLINELRIRVVCLTLPKPVRHAHSSC